jgi:hypothetical protein
VYFFLLKTTSNQTGRYSFSPLQCLGRRGCNWSISISSLFAETYRLSSILLELPPAPPMAAAAAATWRLWRPYSSALLSRRVNPRFLRTTPCVSYPGGAAASAAPPSPPLATTCSDDGGGGMRWEKKRVVLRVGYVGTEYRGLVCTAG